MTLIAEVSSNHGGSIPLAKEFIHRFAEAGADYVKFQTTRVKHLNPADPQYAWFAQSEISDEDHYVLKECCETAGTQFLTTVYNAAELPFIKGLGCPIVKFGSGESDDVKLRRDAMALQLKVWRSVQLTGLRWVEQAGGGPETVFSCVTRYPASVESCRVAISRVGYYGVCGYSDHSNGLEMARWAIECGATIVEKHVSLPNQARVEKSYEATVAEFKALRQFADEGPERFIGRWSYGG